MTSVFFLINNSLVLLSFFMVILGLRICRGVQKDKTFPHRLFSLPISPRIKLNLCAPGCFSAIGFPALRNKNCLSSINSETFHQYTWPTARYSEPPPLNGSSQTMANCLMKGVSSRSGWGIQVVWYCQRVVSTQEIVAGVCLIAPCLKTKAYT